MAEINRPAIAVRITQAREQAGLTQAEMADALSVHPRTYWNYEDEDPRTPWGLLNEIAKITGKSTEWLIHGETATPEMFAKVSSVDQVDAGFVEFRKHVDKILERLDRIEGLLSPATEVPDEVVDLPRDLEHGAPTVLPRPGKAQPKDSPPAQARPRKREQ